MKTFALEDLSVGQRFRSKSVALSEAEIIRFARENDPQFFHIDPEAATASIFGGLIASGWQTAALAIRLLLDAMGGQPLNGVVGADTKVSWRRPVRPGDELRIEAEITDIRRPRSKPDRGFVTVEIQLLDREGDEVQRQKISIIVFRRGVGT